MPDHGSRDDRSWVGNYSFGVPSSQHNRIGLPIALAVTLTVMITSACSRSEEPAVVTLPEQSATTSVPTRLTPDDNGDRDDLPTEPLGITWVVQVGGAGDDEFHGVTATGPISSADGQDDESPLQNIVAVGSATAVLTEPHPEAPEEPVDPADPAGPGSTVPSTTVPATTAPPTTVPPTTVPTTTIPPTTATPPTALAPWPEEEWPDDPSIRPADPASPTLSNDQRVLVSRVSAEGTVLRSDLLPSRGPAAATSVATVHAPGATGESASLPIGCGISRGDLAGPPLGLDDAWCGPVATTLDEPDGPNDLARIFGFGFNSFAADANESIDGVATTDPEDDANLAATQNMFLAGRTDGIFPGAGDSAGRGLGQGDALTFRTSLRDGTSWIRQFGTPFADAATDVCTTGGNGYFVGWTDGDLAGSSAGGRDGWISMIDSVGMQRWLVQFGYAADEEFRSVACTGEPAEGTQQFVAVGTTNGDGPQASNGGTDAVITSFAPDGSTLWAAQFGGSGDDEASAVVVADDIIYVVGTTTSPARVREEDEDGAVPEEDPGDGTFGLLDDTIGPGGSSDGFLTAIDATTGAILWTSRFGSAADESISSATITAEGLLVVTGSTTGALGDYASAGGRDAFAMAFELPSAGGGGAQSWV